jgi:hypothetical protein
MKTTFRFAAALLLAASANAYSGLDVNLICPASASFGAGNNMLIVGVEVANDSWQDEVTLRRYAATMIANTSGTLTGLSVFGPFARTRTKLVIPPATSWPAPVVSMDLPALVVPDAVGTMGLLQIEFLSADGHELGGDDCWVRIVP